MLIVWGEILDDIIKFFQTPIVNLAPWLNRVEMYTCLFCHIFLALVIDISKEGSRDEALVERFLGNASLSPLHSLGC